MSPKSFKIVFLILAGFVTLAVFIAPYTCQYGSLLYLDGSPGYIDHGELWASQNPFACVVYTLGDMFCHQQMARTFILNGSEMPFCTRDVALVVGLTIGLATTILFDGKNVDRKYIIAFIAASFVLMAADWIIQSICGLNVTWSRVATGVLAGASIGLIVSMVIDRLYEKG